MSGEASRPAAVWASGDAYEPFIGRWSRRGARELLAWLAVPAGRRWLDVGCGSGALSQTILALEKESVGLFSTERPKQPFTRADSAAIQREIREDRHPVVLVCGNDIVNLLRQHGYTSPSAVRAWLDDQSRQ